MNYNDFSSLFQIQQAYKRQQVQRNFDKQQKRLSKEVKIIKQYQILMKAQQKTANFAYNPISYISQYTSQSYFMAVEQFEQLIADKQSNNLLLTQIKKISQRKVEPLDRQKIKIKKLNELSQKDNPNVLTQFINLRTVKCKHLVFMFGSDLVEEFVENLYYCLILVMPQIQSQGFQKTMKQFNLNSLLWIRQPYVCSNTNLNEGEHSKHNKKLRKICIIKYQNTIANQNRKGWRDNCQHIKARGNELFNKKEYYVALLYYQYALTFMQEEKDRKLRAILYSNSAACLYQLKLYHQTIRYSKISIAIDQSYPKSFFRKINGYLQLKQFEQIPSLLVQYSGKVAVEKLHETNSKYTSYIANTLGIFNWHDILGSRDDDGQFCDYVSNKLEIRQIGDRVYYYAKEDIKPHEILVMSKPIFLLQDKCIVDYSGHSIIKDSIGSLQINKTTRINLHEAVRQLRKYMQLQGKFMDTIFKLPNPLSNDQNMSKISHKNEEKLLKLNIISSLSNLDNKNSNLLFPFFGYQKEEERQKEKQCYMRVEKIIVANILRCYNIIECKQRNWSKFQLGCQQPVINRSQKMLQLQSQKGVQKLQNYGIFKQFYHFKHSCLANSSFVHIKNSLLITSSRPIAKSSQLTLDYSSYQIRLRQGRKNYLSFKYQIECECKICNSGSSEEINFCEYLDDQKGQINYENLGLLKKSFWVILKKPIEYQLQFGLLAEYNQSLKTYLYYIQIETHWIDILKLIWLHKIVKMGSSKALIRSALQKFLGKIFSMQGRGNQLIDYFL